MKSKITIFAVLISLLLSAITYGVNEPVIAEAESGTLGADYVEMAEGEISYVSILTNLIDPILLFVG